MRYSDVFVRRNAPYTPPRYLLEGLHRMDDGRLRLRWSDDKQKWCLERKVAAGIEYIRTLPHYLNRKHGLVENDSWIRARDGYILVGFYDPQPVLGEWVLKNLQFYNIRRMGGAQAAELELLRIEERKERDTDRNAEIHREAIAKDFYESEVWRQGERVAVPTKYADVRK